MGNRDFGDSGRLDRDLSEAQRAQQEAMKTAGQHLEEFERAKREAMKPATQHIEEIERAQREATRSLSDYDLKQIMQQVSSARALDSMARNFQSATHTARANLAQRVVEGLNIAEHNRRIAEQVGTRFSLLSTNEAFSKAIRESVERTYQPIKDTNAALLKYSATQVANLARSSAFEAALENVNSTLVESVRPEVLSAAKYMAAESLLKDNLLASNVQATIRNTVSGLRENYSEIFRRARDLALDPTVREMVELADREGLVEEAASALLREQFAPENSATAEEIEVFEYRKEPSEAQIEEWLLKYFLYFLIALTVASAGVYGYVYYKESLQRVVDELAVVYAQTVSNTGEEHAEAREAPATSPASESTQDLPNSPSH